jgi:hypothetical protein
MMTLRGRELLQACQPLYRDGQRGGLNGGLGPGGQHCLGRVSLTMLEPIGQLLELLIR